MAYASSPRRCSTKRYILAALVGTVVFAIIVMAVSAVLSPGEVHFSITDTSSMHIVSTTAGGKELNLTLTANNTSHRAGVNYRSVIVSLLYISSADKKSAIPLDNVSPPSWQPPGSTASVRLSAFFPDFLLELDFAGRGENATRISVRLDTDVRFKYGRVYTRSYNIKVVCNPVDYFSHNKPRLPIKCNED
ncbi:hypothetical protein ACQ4PT_047687 [Festuca glaucescens]